MSHQPRYSIVIPCYNEAAHIGALLRRVDTTLCNTDHEIIVMIDGCTDNTSNVIHTAMQSMPAVRLLESRHRLGKGGAIRRGVLDATGEYICFIDGDNEIDPQYIINAFMALEKGKDDIVIGNRYSRGSMYRTTIARHITSHTYRGIIWLLFGISLSDTQAGLKAFTRAAGRRLFHASTTSGYAFDIDILMHARSMGYRVTEIPIKQHFKGTTSITTTHILEMIADTCSIYNRHAHELFDDRRTFGSFISVATIRSILFLPWTMLLEWSIRRCVLVNNR